MLSFVGWEAVAPLTGRLRAGQLSRVIGIAFTVTAVLYLGLAVATVSCLGQGADLSVPLADLLQLAVGPAGRAIAAAAALILTAGSVNAYLSGAAEMLRELTAAPSQDNQNNRPNGAGHLPRPPVNVFSASSPCRPGPDRPVRAAAGRHHRPGQRAGHDVPVRLPQLHAVGDAPAGRETRAAAAVAVLAVLAVLVFSGWTALLAAGVVAALAPAPRALARRRPGPIQPAEPACAAR